MARYIELDKAHELVRMAKQYFWSSPVSTETHHTVDVDDIQFGLDKLPTVDSHQWISVKERLPEDRKQRVLVSLADECVYGNEQIDTDRCSAGIWVRYGENVTHWMPLPEPPKVDAAE